MAPHGYEEKTHSADLALKVWGEDFNTILYQAAKGMFALMGVRFVPDESIAERFSISRGSKEEILVDFLTEILFLLEDRRIVLSEFEMEDGDVIQLTGVFHPLLSVDRWIKAVTFHNLAVVAYPDRLETIITFDV